MQILGYVCRDRLHEILTAHVSIYTHVNLFEFLLESIQDEIEIDHMQKSDGSDVYAWQ